jgi:cellulose synthase/poly-beta-1,6-N-acetylglucosamine synthase-like glycosyltransferase
MFFDVIAGGIVVLAVAAFCYHHFVYPMILNGVAARRRWDTAQSAEIVLGPSRQPAPTVTLIVPAYNEERYIAEKVRNLAALEYPRDRIGIVIALDGCTDATEQVAREALEVAGSPSHISLRVHRMNRGKLALLNEEIAAATGEIVALSDASAVLAPDALLREVAPVVRTDFPLR